MSTMKSNQQLKQVIGKFFDAADAALVPESDLVSVFQSETWSMHNGAVFKWTSGFARNLRDLVAGVLKSQGPNKVNEKQIEKIAWDIATSGSKLQGKTLEFITSVEGEVTKPYERVDPCFSVVLNGIPRLKIGRVSVENTAKLTVILNKRDPRWAIEPNKLPGSTFDGSRFVVSLPAAVWKVSVDCFKGNVRDEAAWLIDVALSLLRLSIPAKKRVGYFPPFGSTESAPTLPPRTEDHGITLSTDAASFDGSSLNGWYEVTNKTFSKKQLQELDRIADAVMNSITGTVAERFARGLGWLSRARRATDQADRFLYFFTAIESLLTRSDKNAPVTDTICRSAACILAKTVEARVSIAKELSALYGIRSVLVHSGERSVARVDSKDLQIKVELVFFNVLKKIDLSKRIDDFHSELKTASYGGRWP